MSKYFNSWTGCLVDSTDGTPQSEDVTELSDLEYAICDFACTIRGIKFTEP